MHCKIREYSLALQCVDELTNQIAFKNICWNVLILMCAKSVLKIVK